jgi:gamma-glutamylcyclotransferase (GGCT)/AIG2-like uncharacterized protein YtfP
MMKSATKSEIVFVYGTLRRGGSNAFRMDGADFLGAGSVRGHLYRIDWYPGLILAEDGVPILGEIYAVPTLQLAALDEFEGVSADENAAEYRRVKTRFTPADTAQPACEAWVWEWIGPTDESQRIPGGDWLSVIG